MRQLFILLLSSISNFSHAQDSESSTALCIFANGNKLNTECPVNNKMTKSFSKKEQKIILSGDTLSKLSVFQTNTEKEFTVLKSTSSEINFDDPLIPLLKQRMLLTVQDPEHSGVGIAAPQVGINKNLIWVQRFDKADNPFEFYINPRIIWRSQLTRTGIEGCLSIPNQREEVNRSYAIQLQYSDSMGNIVEENIEGFTAVIFQHEVDHLKGILFTDRINMNIDKKVVNLSEKIVFSIEENTIAP